MLYIYKAIVADTTAYLRAKKNVLGTRNICVVSVFFSGASLSIRACLPGFLPSLVTTNSRATTKKKVASIATVTLSAKIALIGGIDDVRLGMFLKNRRANLAQ